MKLNKIIFPAPKSSYNSNQLLGEIVYIPRFRPLKDYNSSVSVKNQSSQGSSSTSVSTSSLSTQTSSRGLHIPCLFLPYTSGSSKLLLYFHGNAEDIGLSYEMLDHLRSSLKINILAVEYPGYGIYTDSGGCDAEKITEDCELVYKYVLDETVLREKDMLIFGRSMGSGPATYLSANFKPGGLILMSPYTSIKNVVKSKVGFLSFMVAEHFDNLTLMAKVTCPTFIVHGQKDTLIPYDHAQQLHEKCQGQTFMVLPTEMTHNDFDFYQDLIKPIFQFLMQINLHTGPTKRVQKVHFSETLYIPPEDCEGQQEQLKAFMGQSVTTSTNSAYKRQIQQVHGGQPIMTPKIGTSQSVLEAGLAVDRRQTFHDDTYIANQRNHLDSSKRSIQREEQKERSKKFAEKEKTSSRGDNQ